MKLSLLIKTEIEGSRTGGCVDFWKVGKLNHNQAVEQSALGTKFLGDATALLERYGCNYYVKEDQRTVVYAADREFVIIRKI